MANPSAQLAVGTDGPAHVEQDASPCEVCRDGLDAGELVTFTGDDVAGAAPVPGTAVVEDVA